MWDLDPPEVAGAYANWGLDRYVEIMAEAEEIPPAAEDYDASDSEEEEEEEAAAGAAHEAMGSREAQVEAAALALVEGGAAAGLAEARGLAEEQVLRGAFDRVDVDGSGRVDAREVLEALRGMGAAATAADVRAMMAAVDEGGRLGELAARVEGLQQREAELRAGGIGLKGLLCLCVCVCIYVYMCMCV